MLTNGVFRALGEGGSKTALLASITVLLNCHGGRESNPQATYGQVDEPHGYPLVSGIILSPPVLNCIESAPILSAWREGAYGAIAFPCYQPNPLAHSRLDGLTQSCQHPLLFNVHI